MLLCESGTLVSSMNAVMMEDVGTRRTASILLEQHERPDA